MNPWGVIARHASALARACAYDAMARRASPATRGAFEALAHSERACALGIELAHWVRR